MIGAFYIYFSLLSKLLQTFPTTFPCKPKETVCVVADCNNHHTDGLCLTLLAFITKICSSFTVSLFFSRKPSHWYSTCSTRNISRGYSRAHTSLRFLQLSVQTLHQSSLQTNNKTVLFLDLLKFNNGRKKNSTGPPCLQNAV